MKAMGTNSSTIFQISLGQDCSGWGGNRRRPVGNRIEGASPLVAIEGSDAWEQAPKPSWATAPHARQPRPPAEPALLAPTAPGASKRTQSRASKQYHGSTLRQSYSWNLPSSTSPRKPNTRVVAAWRQRGGEMDGHAGVWSQAAHGTTEAGSPAPGQGNQAPGWWRMQGGMRGCRAGAMSASAEPTAADGGGSGDGGGGGCSARGWQHQQRRAARPAAERVAAAAAVAAACVTCAPALYQIILWSGPTPGEDATPPKERMAEAAKMEDISKVQEVKTSVM